MFKTAINAFIEDVKKYKTEIIIGSSVYLFITLLFGKTCIMRILFGIPCPFCGFTRAFLKLLCLDFIAALKLQPFILLLLILVLLFVLKRYFKVNISRRVLLALIIIGTLGVIVLYAFRMVHYYPTSEPMNYDGNNLLKVVIDKFFGG